MTAMIWHNFEALSERAVLVLLMATFVAILLVLVILFTAVAVGPQQLRDGVVRRLTPDG